MSSAVGAAALGASAALPDVAGSVVLVAGSTMLGRSLDRLEVYAEQTAPLTEVYGGRGSLVRVDGVGEVDEVTGRLTRALQPYRG